MTATSPVTSAVPAGYHYREGYAYADPSTTLDALPGLDGLTFLQQIGDGTLPHPPVMTTLGIRPLSVERGAVEFVFTPQPWHYNPIGSVHGGVISTMLDSAAACAVHSTLPAGQGYTTLDLTVKFLRGITSASGEVRAKGKVLNAGRRTALAEAVLVDSRDRILAHAISTCLILDL